MPLNESDANVLAYFRSYKNRSVLVLLNMSPAERTVRVPSAEKAGPPLLASGSKAIGAGEFVLAPFGVYIAEAR